MSPAYEDDLGTRPYAYLSYIVFDAGYILKDAGAIRVPDAAGFNPGNELAVAPQQLAFAQPIQPQQTGYIYIWVSNETQGSKVWFDDVKVTHTYSRVTQASDYYAFGSVMREQKSPDDLVYRYGYQGKYAEKDEETGWGHFKVREYDDIIGRWTAMDPKRQFSSGYVGMGNNPVSKVDPDGAYSIFGALWRTIAYRGSFTSKVEDGKRTYGYIKDGYAQYGNIPSGYNHLYGYKAPPNDQNIKPYVSISIGKESTEVFGGVNPKPLPPIAPLSGNAGVMLTQDGAFATPIGGDVSFAYGGSQLSGVSVSLSVGFIIGPTDGLSGWGYYATMGANHVGIQVSQSLNGDYYPDGFGGTYTIGSVISTSKIWVGGGLGYSVPIDSGTIRNTFK